METTIQQKTEQIGRSITLKAIIVGILILLLLIPSSMIQGLISERQNRSEETIAKINEKWSKSQTLNGPVLVVPYSIKKIDEKKNILTENHFLYLTPEQLTVKVNLTPEERHFGIYKSILYKSNISISGFFDKVDSLPITAQMRWNEAYIKMGITDLRGIENDPDFMINNSHFTAKTDGKTDVIGEGLFFSLRNQAVPVSEKRWNFNCSLQLKGSSDISFIPVGRNTNVDVEGNWKAPGFIGGYSPEYKLTEKGFTAHWNILHFNRNIPEYWIDNTTDFKENYLGVNLVDTVDHYQLNMRSAKYAIMFIMLTFVVFFFVEIITQKRIHPMQYLLVGLALILFYTLLLSLSEQIRFGFAYLIASLAIIGLITAYAHTIFKDKKKTAIMGVLLAGLYVFLYVVLQLEDIALLIGSIGLFIILGAIMAVSGKIKWYKDDTKTNDSKIPKINNGVKSEFEQL